jgi:hypothetical protein
VPEKIHDKRRAIFTFMIIGSSVSGDRPHPMPAQLPISGTPASSGILGIDFQPCGDYPPSLDGLHGTQLREVFDKAKNLDPDKEMCGTVPEITHGSTITRVRRWAGER